MQKSFASGLLPFNSKGAFCFLLPIAICLNSCSFNPGLQGKGEAYLQGEWQQGPIPKQNELTQYSLYNIRFSCDSFYMQIKSFDKVNNADSCTRSGHWTEYVKGDYRQSHDTLHVRGQFCNADHSLRKEGGCFRSGIYEESFKVKQQGDSIIEFDPLTGVIPIKSRLVKRIACKQKPL